MSETEYRVVGFTTAAPGWRLWIAYSDGETIERALAGWVTLAEVEPGKWDEPERETGYRVIEAGWVSEGRIETAGGSIHEVVVIGPGEEPMTPEELAEWGAQHRRFIEEQRERMRARS